MKVARFMLSGNGHPIPYERLEFYTENGVQNIRAHLANGDTVTFMFNDTHALDIPLDRAGEQALLTALARNNAGQPVLMA